MSRVHAGHYPAQGTKVSSSSPLSMSTVCSYLRISNFLFLAPLLNTTFENIVSDLSETTAGAGLMPKKSKSTASAVATPAGNGQSNLGVSKTPPLLTTSKAKTSKKSSQAKQVPKATVTSGTGSTKSQAVGKALKDPVTPKIVKIKEKKPSQQSAEQRSLKLLSSKGKGTAVEKLEVKKDDTSRSSTSEQIDWSSPSCVGVQATTSQPGSCSDPESVRLQFLILMTASSIQDTNMFLLAAATPVPMSPTVERQFYESQLLLFVLDRVRGDHTKRQNYHGELDQDATELRRSFLDKLAYICDFKTGGSTVTALALQKTYQGAIFWLAANETVKPRVTSFLRDVLQLLMSVKDNRASKKAIETQLLEHFVSFNEERLDYYWSALRRDLGLCLERLAKLEGSISKLLTSFLFSCPSETRLTSDNQVANQRI
jgi:hypothetical protein